jgi:dihydrofolate synthase / folylpolyglutamate synthase
MNYSESLQYLHGLGHDLHGVCFRLETIEAILERLGSPHRKYQTAIVAGTNGKGSTASFLTSIAEQAGYRTGLYTSPHLVRVNERIRVAGADIGDEDFAAAFSSVRKAVEDLLAKRVLETPPSFFEFLTATAFVHFARAAAEFVVLEVGMGGRLDATNITEPLVAVITPIDLDHQEYLGSTLAAIAGEKAGVIKPGRPVVANVPHQEAAEVIRRRCVELDAPLTELSRDCRISNLCARQGLYSFDLKVGDEFFERLSSPLLGRFQVENATTAVAAAVQLRSAGMKQIDAAAIRDGLMRTAWACRLEAICTSPLFLLDGAHNPAGAKEIAGFIREHLAGRKLRLIYGSMKDKAIREITGLLWPLADEIYLTEPTHPRAASPQDILAHAACQPKTLTIEPSSVRAVERVLAASAPEDVVLAAGSLFLVGEIKKGILEGSILLPANPRWENVAAH